MPPIRPRALAIALCCGIGGLSVTPLAPVTLGVPAPPVPVRAAGRVTLVYELHVADTGARPLRLERLDVRDADRPDAAPVATYGRSDLERDSKLIGPRGAPPPKALAPGVRAVIYARDHRGRRNTDWYGYGQPVLAVADSRVAAVVDGIPDNTPGENSRAVPMRVGTVLGNYVVLDLGARADCGAHRFALYGHLQPGSLRVQAGDSVRRGQVLGTIGNSGNSDGPHLHFHVTEAADSAAAPLRGEGVPFVLDTFTVVAHDPERVAQRARLTALGSHRGELPVEGDVIRTRGPRP
jgi:murein DD-endopeptidase MepM/ murein hydrolase activator NlpD